MIQVLILMTIGMIIGRLIRKKEKLLKLNDGLTTWAVWLLLYLLGLSVGSDEKILNRLDTLGLQALAITAGAIMGSMLMAWFIWLVLFKKKAS